MTKDNQTEFRNIALDLRSIADRMLRLLDSAPTRSTFDPDLDDPAERPAPAGSDLQKAWCGLLFWAQLLSVNIRQGRGATRDEVVEIALRAGYKDGRAWNRWSGWRDEADGRWMTRAGMSHLQNYYDRLDLVLPVDLDVSETSLPEDADQSQPRANL